MIQNKIKIHFGYSTTESSWCDAPQTGHFLFLKGKVLLPLSYRGMTLKEARRHWKETYK